MAIFHCQMSVVSRSTGRSAVASAAYRSATLLVNVRDGVAHDYRRREGVVHSEIVLPDGVDAAWALDRSALWNAAEAAEKRCNARVAREFVLALPHELTADERLGVARSFARELADRYGAAVDFAIHAPGREGDVRNHHAHVLMTTRSVTTDGLGPKTYIEFANKDLLPQGLPSTQTQLVDLRRTWEEIANTELARVGIEARIDHRSHAERGLEIEPTVHMGVRATNVYRRGGEVERGRLGREDAIRNAELIARQPEQILAVLTNERSVFDRHDIARTLHRYLNDDVAAYQNAFAAVMASPALVELSGSGSEDLGKHAQRYSTQEMVRIELELADAAERLGGASDHGVNATFVAQAIAEQDEAMRMVSGNPAARLSAEQVAAVEHVTGPERAAAVIGFAGSGKSTMLSAARVAWEAEGYRVHGAALSGKAAEGLENSAGIRSRTLASWDLGWRNERGTLGANDVFVIDEAGMVGSRQLARFVAEVEERGAKLVLVGDHEQLQAIGAGAPFRAVTEAIGYAELSEIRRQREPWQCEASVALATHRTVDGLRAYADHGDVRFSEGRDAARAAVVASYMRDRAAYPDDAQVAMAHRRVDVRALNEAIRGALQVEGGLRDELRYGTVGGERAFAPGDRIVFLENSRELGVKNGMLGTVEAVEPDAIQVRLDGLEKEAGDRLRHVSLTDDGYRAVDHGYATTIHKTQGATVDRAYVLASPTMDRHLSYVALTRHRDGVELHADASEFAQILHRPSPELTGEALAMAGLEARLSRSGAKETTLDYDPVEAFAERRGIAALFGIRSEIEIPREIAIQPVPAPEPVMARNAAVVREAAISSLPELSLDDRPRRDTRFDGLRLRVEPMRHDPEPRDLSTGQKTDLGPHPQAIASSRTGMNVLPEIGADRGLLRAALDRYAEAHVSIERQEAAGLPVLRMQTREMGAAAEALDRAEPEALALLRSALRHDPDLSQTIERTRGRERVEALLDGLGRERRAQADPAIRADRVISAWRGIATELRGGGYGRSQTPEAREARAQMRELLAEIDRDPDLRRILCERHKEIGLDRAPAIEASLTTTMERGLERSRQIDTGTSIGY